MLSKSLIKFSVDGWSCVPSLLFIWAQSMVEVMKIMVTSLKRPHACAATVRAPNPAAGHHQPTPLPETPGHSQASLLWGHCSFLLGPGAQVSVVPSRSLLLSPMQVLAAPWWAQWRPPQRELMPCHTQSPVPAADPLPTHDSWTIKNAEH